MNSYNLGFYIIFGIFTLTLFVFSIFEWHKSISISKHKLIVESKIVGKEVNNQATNSYEYDVSYSINKNEYVNSITLKHDYEVGDQIKIIINKNEPRKIVNYSKNIYRSPIIVTILFFLLFVFYLIVLRNPELLEKFNTNEGFPKSS